MSATTSLPVLVGVGQPIAPTPAGPPSEPSWVKRVDPRVGAMFGKYQVQSVIGKGGMGLVYEGEDTILGRRVAIKFLPDSLIENPKAVERFITEAQVAGRLNHPNVVAIYDIGQEGDHYFIVMELLNPQSAANYLKERGAMHWYEATRIIADCCAALQAAHQVGLVHRDLKPDNILCSPTGSTKLVDFGLVKDLGLDGHALTQTGVVAGTPLYMSPEQASDGKVDHRSDLYSLGGTYYALLTGRPPFLGEAAPQIMFKHVTAPTPDPRDLVKDIPEACVQVVMRAMSKKPEDRYQTADEMRKALEQALEQAAPEQRKTLKFLVAQDAASLNVRMRPFTRMTLTGISAMNPKLATSPTHLMTGPGSSKQSLGQAVVLGPAMSGQTPRVASNSGPQPIQPGLSGLSATAGMGEAVGEPMMVTEGPRRGHDIASRSSMGRVLRHSQVALWAGGGLGLLSLLVTLALVYYRLHPAMPTSGSTGTGTGQVTSGNGPGPTPSPTEKLPVQKAVLPPIRVGVLNSLSGTMAISTRPMVDATLLAIDEINQKGGIKGRKIEAVVVDGESKNSKFEQETERLIKEEKVVTIFGGWTPSNRKVMKPIVEKYKHLLVFPSRDEGMEDSQNIIYNGATPNQQVLPALRYVIERLGRKRIAIVGTDGLLGHISSELVKDGVEKLIRDGIAEKDARVVAERFVLLAETNFKPVVKKVLSAKPDVIFNMVNGDSNLPFYRELRAAKVTPDKIPVISFSIGENELQQLGDVNLAGDFLAWNYFESVDRPQNKEFLKNFQAKFGDNRRISDPMEAAYFGVYLWAQAVEQAGSDDVAKIRQAFGNQQFEAPGAPVRIDASNNHTWKVFRLGRIQKDGGIEIVYSSDKPIPPEPFPTTRTRAEWEALLDHLRTQWGGTWVNPAMPNLLKGSRQH